MKAQDTGDEGYRLLASTIIATACTDYVNSVRYLNDNRDSRKGYAWKLFYEEWNDIARARISSSPDWQRKVSKLRNHITRWYSNIVISERMSNEVRDFLHSSWFDVLSYEPMNGDYIIKLLDKKAVYEKYDRKKIFAYINLMKSEAR